jgi:elongation factor G
VETEYTHKKQSGGHGQYGRVNMRFRPLERGEGFQFANEIRGGSIGKGYMPGIEKGIIEAMEEGPLAGYPVVDLAAVVFDGKEHPVDSSEMAFKMAARGALKQAYEKAAPKLLEPYVKLHVFVEDTYMGDVLSDLSSKRGRVEGQNDLGGGIVEIVAEVPQGELLRYSIDLRSITSGTGGFEMEFSHYEPVMGKIAENIIADAKARDAEE